MALTVVDGGMLSATNAQYTMFKNRLINCEMSIDQRNAGAAISTAGGGYVVDRWQVQYGTGTLTLQQSTQAPAGFVNSIGITVTSVGTRLATDYFLLNQKIEGFNFSDLNFGSANAATVTLSFWVRSSVTGTYSGVLASGDNTRTYPFNYTISAANTWEQKSVTVAGDTSGGTTAYPITNGIGLFVKFDLGSGTNYELASAGSWQVATNKIGTTSQVGWAQTSGATFYITGVQLEKGSTATAFDYRPIGTELSLCQRYYSYLSRGLVGGADSTTEIAVGGICVIPMRSSPTIALTQTTPQFISGGTIFNGVSSAITDSTINLDSYHIRINGFTGLTTGRACVSRNGSGGGLITLSAEL